MVWVGGLESLNSRTKVIIYIYIYTHIYILIFIYICMWKAKNTKFAGHHGEKP